MKHKAYIFAGLALSLVSCVNFTTISTTPEHTDPEYHYLNRPKSVTPTATPARPGKAKPSGDAVSSTSYSGPVCPVYQLPAFPPMPVIPIEKYAHIRKGDDQALDDLSIKQYAILRAAMSSDRQMVRASYRKYIHDCSIKAMAPAESSAE